MLSGSPKQLSGFSNKHLFMGINMVKKKLINQDFKNGTEEYYRHAVAIAADSRTKGELVELLEEVWDDGRLQGRKELETFQPEDSFDHKNDYFKSDGVVSLIYDKKYPSRGFKTVVPKLIAVNMFGLKKGAPNQRLLWTIEKDGLLFKIVVKRSLKEVK